MKVKTQRHLDIEHEPLIHILVKDIGPEGLMIDQEISFDRMGLTPNDPFCFTAPLMVDAKVEWIDDIVLVRGVVKTRYSLSCSRCLTEIEKDWEKDIILDFSITPETQFIDLGEDVRQEVILSVPAQMVCREDCKGICMGCGVDLNGEDCECK